MSGGDEPEVDDVKVGSLVEGKNLDNDCSINGHALKKQVAMPTEELRTPNSHPLKGPKESGILVEDELMFSQTPTPCSNKRKQIVANLGFDDDDDAPVIRRDLSGSEEPASPPLDNLALESTENHPLALSDQLPSWIGTLQQQYQTNVNIENENSEPQRSPSSNSISYEISKIKEPDPSDSDAESIGSNAQWNVSESCNAEENKSVGDENLPKIGQPLAAPRSNSFFGRLFRSKDPNRTQFERYAQELRHAIDDEEQSIEDCQNEAKQIKKDMRKETKKWRRFAQVSMENMARTYFENRLLLIGSKIEISAARLEVLNERLNHVGRVLDGQNMNSLSVVWFDESGNFMAPTDLPVPPEVHNMIESCNTMKQVVDDLKIQYMELRKESSVKKKRDERHGSFSKVLEIAYTQKQSARHSNVESKFYWHPPHIPGTQLKFNCLVLDERYSPGILLRRWYSKVEKQESVEPQAITAFIDYLTKYLINHYNLDSKYFATIVLFLDRLIFPRIKSNNKKPLFRAQQTEQESKADHIFFKKSCWLRLLTQEQIGINPDFCKKEIDENDLSKYDKLDVPFGPAIQNLVEARVFVPTDIFYSILQSIRCINSCAQAHCYKENAVICADDLFPMVVYVVVHSRLSDINTRLGLLERYIKHEIKYFGEAAICLSLLQAAVAYISGRTPSEFDLPNEIEEEMYVNYTQNMQNQPNDKAKLSFGGSN